MTSTSKNKEMKDKRADSIEAVQEANEQPSLPSIYSIAAAHSLSKDPKQKSLHLIKVRRRHGDYGQFDLTHAWSPEDLMDDLGSRYGSGRSRDSTLADESLQSWTKLLRKLRTWGAFFLNFVADRFFPPPLPLEAMLLGLQKKAGSLSICRKQL